MNKYIIEFTTKRYEGTVRAFIVNLADVKDLTEWVERQKNAMMIAWLKDSDLYNGQSPKTFKSDAICLKKDGKKFIDPRTDTVVARS